MEHIAYASDPPPHPRPRLVCSLASIGRPSRIPCPSRPPRRHNLFLHSALVHSRDVDGDTPTGGGDDDNDAAADADADTDAEPAASRRRHHPHHSCDAHRMGSTGRRLESIVYYNVESALALCVTLFINVCVVSVFARGFFGRETQEGERTHRWAGSGWGVHGGGPVVIVVMCAAPARWARGAWWC